MDAPTTRFAHAGDYLIAYNAVGDGPVDLVFLLGWPHNVEVFWELPAAARFFRRLASFSRVILFDRRGTGLSDRGFETYAFETVMDDLAAVLDDIGSERTAFIGCEVGARAALMFAAAHPERTSAVISFAGHPTSFRDDDYPWGATPEEFEAQLSSMEHGWGQPETMDRLLDMIAPSAADDPATKVWWRKMLMSTSRREGMGNFRTSVEVDVRPLLGSVRVPVLVMHRTDDAMASIDASRYMAERIPGARFVELPGNDHFPFFGDQDAVVEEVEAFLTGARTAAEADRVLATVLFSDIVGSTERAAALGDRKWRDLLDAHDDLARKRVGEFKGRIVDHQGDGFLATFDGPARAIRCALSLRDGVRGLGLETRAGVHTGEVEVRGDNIGGIAVHIGARVAAKAGPGEVFVSRTVADLVVGSSLEFEDRGVHALKGVPGEWQLYAVKA
ncbi:MAG TPA: adenylate/guanylate cyclase domain-containing protein [Actinomycetota bacterium]|nr:adenylate/guanylate cyclase domain-containing protein [Actinomycetota bacterium]